MDAEPVVTEAPSGLAREAWDANRGSASRSPAPMPVAFDQDAEDFRAVRKFARIVMELSWARRSHESGQRQAGRKRSNFHRPRSLETVKSLTDGWGTRYLRPSRRFVAGPGAHDSCAP